MIANNLSEEDLATRLRRLEKHVLDGRTPEAVTVDDGLIGDSDIDLELAEITVTDLFKTPVYESTADVPDLETGHIVTIEGDGLYVATGD